MCYRANVDGCYIAWSPALHAAYRYYRDSPRFTLAKIGSSGDIFSRMDSLNGLESYFSKVKARPYGHAHTNDWVPWRIRQERKGLTREQLERDIQHGRPRLTAGDWEAIHKRLSNRSYLPKVQEIFIVEIDRINEVLPTVSVDIVPDPREADRELSTFFREEA